MFYRVSNGGTAAGTYRVYFTLSFGIQYDVQGSTSSYIDITINNDGTTSYTPDTRSGSRSGSWGGRTGNVIGSITITSIVKVA